MRVGFGTTVLSTCLRQGEVDGIGSYTKELGHVLSEDQRVTLLPATFGRAVPEGFFPGLRSYGLGPYVPLAGMAAVTPFPFPIEQSLQRRIDLFHATDHLIPKFKNIPVVATLMDAIPLSHPEWVRTRLATLKRWLWQRTANWADHIVTISEYSKQEIIKHFDISHDRISVIPLGVDQRYFQRITLSKKQEVIARLALPSCFFLCLGTLQPRKNVSRVLDAHNLLPISLRKEVPLIVVGRAGWGSDRLIGRLRGSDGEDSVRWLEYLSDQDVRVLLQSALALVFPSLCEGFGLPVIEAFASGLPVITSNTTSLPEVAGDAALLVNPENTAEISDAMKLIIDSAETREKLVQAGLARGRMFSWQSCAEETLAVYRSVTAV